MDPIDEFRKHAAECRRAAQSTKDPADRAQWQSLAGRWERCLEAAQAATAAAENVRHARHRGARPVTGRGMH
jgi:hypothetical protein